MYVIRKLVQSLIMLAETGESDFSPGVLRKKDGSPILDIPVFFNSEEVQEKAKKLLDLASRKKIEVIETEINSSGLIYTLFTNIADTSPGIMVPSISRPTDLPIAVMVLARCVDTGMGDCILNRITKCEYCFRYFLRKQKRNTRFCSLKCRNDDSNRKRLQKR